MKLNRLVYLSIFMALIGCNSQTNSRSMDTKNREAILSFYHQALTVNSETRPTEALTPLLSEGYKSIGSAGEKNSEELIGQLEFFWKLIPDLKWEPQEIINDGDVFVVRSLVTGTPKGDFMGTLTDGSKTFRIMTMDMHSMKGGKFLKTNHVEDWFAGIKQLGPKTKDEAKQTLDIANAFMDAMGKGEMEKMKNLMHEDMVWQNEGDKSLPWIGPWSGKDVILEDFLPVFGENFQTIKWEPNDALSSGDTAAYFGKMIGLLTKSGDKTKEFTYALRVKVKDGKVILWNWFEDSFEVSKTYHK